ncbi:MAG: hypothetical protein NTY02_16020 [Acidobacteria bacterium]|nr:hypothetical protein [Acidobacteriota bacterium]
MVMFLMALCLSMFGLAVTALAFGAATRDERPAETAQPAIRPSLPITIPAARFFADLPAVPAVPLAASRPQVPIEVLLLQIDRHVLLEQAAAESFVGFPTVASLHSRTTSPLVH